MNFVTALGGGLGPGELFTLFPNNFPNPYTVNGRTYLKTGTTALASAYPSVPAAAQITFGADPTKHTLWPTGQNPLSNSNYTATQNFLKTDGSSNMFAISGDGQYAGYSSNGGVSWTSGLTGIAATTVNDTLWFAPGNCWLIFTAAGIYTIPLNSRTATLQQSGNFLSGATDGTTVYATQNSSTTTFYKSTNGTTWATQATTGLTAAYFTCLRYLNSGWVLVGGASIATSNNLYVSSNGVAWSAGNPTTTTYTGVNDIAYGGGYYFFVNGKASSGPSYGAFWASLTSGAGATTALYIGTSAVNVGSIAWNGTYFAVGFNNTATSNYAFCAVLPNSNSPTFGYIYSNGTQQNSGNGSICAFASGPYAGQFFQGANYNSGSNLIWNTLVGTYINAGLNIGSSISNMNFYMRVA